MKRNISLAKTAWFLLCFSCVSGLNEPEINHILKVHNGIRRSVANGQQYSGLYSSDMKKLVWSDELQAQVEATLNCDYSASRPDDPTDVHTNVGASTNGNITRILQSWVNEKDVIQTELGYPTCTNLHLCNRFLTMINSKHRRIGCALTNRCRVNSRTTHFFLCKYDGGDLLVPPFKKGIPCTGCDRETSFCENGLCVPCNENSTSCDCRKTCNKPDIGSGILNNSTCTCNCVYGLGPNCDQDCVNPSYYLEFDICSLFTAEDCLTPFEEDREILRESCPATCACRRHPNARDSNNVAVGMK